MSLFTFQLDAIASLIMFAGIFYGAMYGGSTTAILINMPGEAPAVATTIDGYQMARKGRAGAALAVAAIGSFIAGTMGLIGLMFFAPVLSRAALAFGPQEYFAMALLGLLLLSNLTGGSLLKSFAMVLLGITLGSLGMDPLQGNTRLTFGLLDLERGIEFSVMAMGLFGISELLNIIVEPYRETSVDKVKLRELYPSKEELQRSIKPMFRGGLIGFFIGLLPGPIGMMSAFASYALEKKVAKDPAEFGHGAIEGVAGPESANNAASSGAMVPLLALGFPFTAATAMLLSGLVIHGITPGPLLIKQHPQLFWGLMASMYVGNTMLLILNLPLVGIFANLVRVSPRILIPIVIIITFSGAYSINNSIFDLVLVTLFGIIGYLMKKADYPLAPLAIGLVLGPILETGLRQALVMEHGNLLTFIQRPISGVMVLLAVVVIAYRVISYFTGRKALTVFTSED